MPVEFTSEQQRVIDVRNRNVLVSAAAGSGKTAVLVERIIRRILDEQDRLLIDRLLVVTFTEKAANEMRTRIGDAIEEELNKNPDDEYLQMQQTLLYKAQISTIHSFCLNLIRNNFNKIGLDPSFRVADETELKLMAEDVLDAYFEEMYASKDSEFEDAVTFFDKGYSDEQLRENVKKLASFADAYPWPADWLNEVASLYEVKTVEDLEQGPFLKYLDDYVNTSVSSAINMANKALMLCDEPDGPSGYRKTVDADIEYLEQLRDASSYEERRSLLAGSGFPRLTPKPGDECAPEKAEKFKALRSKYKDMITGTKSGSISKYYVSSLEDELNLLQRVSGKIRKLVEITVEYMTRFETLRTEKGIISFSDMEHFAIRILYDEENGKHVLSNAAREYTDAFDEILMDEYQDCNKVQEQIVYAVSGEANGLYHRFMVGDVKQSIYKFRMASPELFIEKSECYPTADCFGQGTPTCERIDLHKNFRSRENVINTVNDLFSQIMRREIGGIDYDKDAALVCGASYPEYVPEKEAGLGDVTTDSETLLLTLDNDSDLKRGEQEARMIASTIKQLMLGYSVTDKKTGQLRPVMFKDIVILLRSMTDVAEGIKNVFYEEGIPCYMTLKNGFYDAKEVQCMIEFLKVIDNPLQDIPLYGVLTSYFGGFSETEIAELRCEYPRKLLYDELKAAASENEKVSAFLDMLNSYRSMSKYTPIHELINIICLNSGYLDYVGAGSGGRVKRANVRMLINKAASFEKTSFKGLFHFVRYIKQLSAIDLDEGEADVLDENADVVRVMTIHKSKGLEFPVCFVSGIHKEFNKRDLTDNLVLDMDFGIGAFFVDPDNQIKKNTLLRDIVALKSKREMLGEELRVLYVALTRAKEKLILTGVVKDSFELPKDDSLYDLSSANSYLDMALPYLPNPVIVGSGVFTDEALYESVRKIDLLTEFQALVDDCEYSELRAELQKRFEKKYPHPEYEGLVLKTSVSEIKKAYMDTDFSREMYPNNTNSDEFASEGRSDSSQGQRIGGADRGSAYHKVMELLDFNNKDVKSQINKMVNEDLITQDWADAVQVSKITRFLDSELGKRMANAQAEGLLKREQPFVLGVSANRINPAFPATETILLQGIIDAFFIEDGRIVLMDYKTDVIDSGSKLMHRYGKQLELYKEALANIMDMEVKECILYSFHLESEVV